MYSSYRGVKLIHISGITDSILKYFHEYKTTLLPNVIGCFIDAVFWLTLSICDEESVLHE